MLCCILNKTRRILIKYCEKCFNRKFSFLLCLLFSSPLGRYYNDAKGECLPCSKCCGDDHDLVEVECQEKLGPGSNMICSFTTNVNRRGKAANLRCQYEHTTVPMTITATPDNYNIPSQGSRSEQTDSNNLSLGKDQGFWMAVIIPAVILTLLAIYGCVYIYKTGLPNDWCRADPKMDSGALDAGKNIDSLDYFMNIDWLKTHVFSVCKT